MWLLQTKKERIYSKDIRELQVQLTSKQAKEEGGIVYKIKTSPLQRAIMISSLIGNLLAEYNPAIQKDRAKAVDTLRGRVRKFMYIRSRSNKKEFLSALSYADRAWQNTMAHFAPQKQKLEIVATTIRLHAPYSEELSRYAGVHEKQIAAFAHGFENNIDLKIEQDSYEIADYLLNEIGEFTERKPQSLSKRLKINSSKETK